MNVRRILGVAALGAAATSLVFVPGAGAQTPETYAASSSGEALKLSVFEQGLTVAATTASVAAAESLSAAASGVGFATPVFEAGVTEATVEGSGQNGSTDPTCEGELPEIPGVSIGLACSSSFAEIADSAPRSAATGEVGDIVLNPVSALLDTPLSEVVAPVEDGVNQLLDGLAPITGPIDDATELGLDDTLRDLFGALFGGADLVTVSVGDTVVDATVTADTVTSTCTAQGARIDVLDPPPVAGVDAPPVISVIVGEAGTSVVTNRADATATAEVNPALVTVVVPSLGINQSVTVGQTIEIPLPEPLGTSTITVADGTTGTDDAGNTFATAHSVNVDLLNGEALMGGVELALAGCTSSAGVSPAQVPTTTTEPPQLPTTGADGPNPLALAAAVGFAGLGLTLVRRTRAVA